MLHLALITCTPAGICTPFKFTNLHGMQSGISKALIVVVSLEAHSIVGCVCGSLLDNFDWMIHHHIQCMILVAFDAVSSIGLVEEGLLLDALLSCLAIHRPYCRFEGL